MKPYFQNVFRAFVCVIIFLACYFEAYCQPSNDGCFNPSSLSSNFICNATIGSTVGATEDPLFAGCGNWPDDDVWYSFVASAGDTVTIWSSSILFDVDIFEGPCTALLLKDCGGTIAYNKVLKYTGFTSGKTYRVRVYGKQQVPANTGSFSICVKKQVSVPANDACTNAVTITPGTACSTTNGTTFGATTSTAPACIAGGVVADDEVWYKFIPTTQSDTITVTGASPLDAVIQLYSGSCSSFTSLACKNGTGTGGKEKLIYSNYQQGQTYYFRVFGAGTGLATAGTFTVCIRSGTSFFPPPNDNCSGAYSLTVNTSCVTTFGSTLGGTASGVSSTNCTSNPGNPDDDVWFKFTSLSPGDSVIVKGSGTFDGAIQLFKGSCTSPVMVSCSNNTGSGGTEKAKFAVLSAQTCYVRVYSSGGSATNQGNFTICIKKGTGIFGPPNDECESATVLSATVSSNQTGTTVGAGPSSYPYLCDGTPDDDVWYRVNNATHGYFKVVPSAGKDISFEVYLDSCDALVPVAGVENNSAGREEIYYFTPEYFPGDYVSGKYTIFFRVFSKGSQVSDQGTFTAYFAPSVTNGILGDDNPFGAYPGSPNISTTGNCPVAPTTGFTTGFCAHNWFQSPCNYEPDDVYWIGIIPTTTFDTIRIIPVGNYDPHVEVYAGNGAKMQGLVCMNEKGPGETETFITTRLLPNNGYVLRISGVGPGSGKFVSCYKRGNAPSGVANDLSIAPVELFRTDTCKEVFGSTRLTTVTENLETNYVNRPSDDDVWYLVRSAVSGDTIRVRNLNGFQHELALYAYSSNIVLLASSNVNYSAINDSTYVLGSNVGYLAIRLFSKGFGQSTRGDFTICYKKNSLTTFQPCLLAELIEQANYNTWFTGSTSDKNSGLDNGYNNSCHGSGVILSRSKWYKFIATSGKVSIVMKSQVASPSYFSVYGSCNTFNFLGCSKNTTQAMTSSMILRNLVIGDTYLVRVSDCKSFRMNLQPLPDTVLPYNDNCDQAQNLNINRAVSVFGSTVSATESGPANTCGSLLGSPDDDVWYRITSTSPYISVTITPETGSPVIVAEALTGLCGNLQLVTCYNSSINTNKTFYVPMTGGEIKLRIYSFGSIASSRFEFKMQIESAVFPPPTNDYVTAKQLVLSDTFAFITESNYGSVRSASPILCNDQVSKYADDVYYKFSSSSYHDTICVEGLNGFKPVIEIIGSNTYNHCAQIPASDGKVYITLYSPNTTIENITFRVYGFALDSSQSQGQFKVAVKRSKDRNLFYEYEIAKPLMQYNLPYTVTRKTSISSQHMPNQPNAKGDDDEWINLWYGYNVSSTSNIDPIINRMRILVEAVGDFDPAFELYYKNFTNAPFLRSSVNNRGVGEPEYMIVEDGPLALRVFDARNGTGSGKYKLTIARDDLSINDDCAGATFLVPADECTPVLGTLNRSNASNTGSGCESPSNSQIKDVWYKFRPTKTFIRATLSCWNNFNGQMQLFKGAGCQNLVLNSCVDSTGAGGQEVINQEGLIPGDVYFLRVAGTDTSGKGDFSLCLKYINCEADKPQISVIPQNSAVNGRLKLKTANIVSRLKWQYSINLGQSWNFLATTKLVDTITILPSMQGTMWIRAYAFDDSCRNGYSNIEVVNVKCASPFSNVLTHNTGDFIQSIRFAEKTVVSGSDSLGGSYQDFSRKDTLSICRSFPFSFHVYPGDSTKIYGKAVWLDLNRDGDFTDPNELQVISQPAAGTFSPVLSLASLGAGVYQMRIGLIRSNSGTIDSNACFQPGYLSGEFEDYSINVGVPQAANAGPDAAVCTDGVFLAGNHPAQTTGLWEAIGNTAQIANPGLFNSLVTGLAPGPNIFRWKVLSVCPVVTDDVVISRSLPPTTASILGLQSPVSVCTNTFRVTGNTPQIGTPLWTKIAGAATLATPSQPSTLLTGLVPGVKILRYSITNAPCPSSFQEITLNATNSLPTADAGLDMAICDSAVGLTGNAVGTGQGTWTVVSGAGTFSNASSPISSVSGLAPGVNMLKWSISKAGCNTSEDFVNIIRQLPENALAGTDQTTCAQSATLTAGPSSNPGTWSLVSGSGTLASPNSSTCVVSGLGEGVNIFRWTLNNPGCPVSSDDVAITVSQNAFVVSAGPDRTLCAQTSDTLNAILPAGTTGLWTVAGGGGAITQPTGATTQVTGLTPGINRFVWTISRPGCASVSDEVMVNIQSQPSSALAGPDVQVCRTLVSLHASAPLAGQGTWTVLNGSAQISDIHNPTAFASSLSDGANKFLWTVGNAPCSSREDTVIITSVSQSGLTALAGIDQTVCGTNGFMKAAGPVSGTGTWSLVSGSGILANPANPQSPVSALGGGANTFAWKVSLDTCSVTDIAIVSRDYNPVHLGNDTTLCTGSSLDINGGTGYATYAWSTLSGNANITVSATNLYSLTATTANGCAYSDSINVIFTICTDVKDPESGINPDVLLFPNPGTGVLHLKFQGLDERVQINVLGLDGKLLSSYEKDLSSAEPVVTLDLTNLANGIYMVEIQTKAKTFHNRVVVQK